MYYIYICLLYILYIYRRAHGTLYKNKPSAEAGVTTVRDGFGGGVELPSHRHHPTDLQGSCSQKETENTRRTHCNNNVGIILY